MVGLPRDAVVAAAGIAGFIAVVLTGARPLLEHDRNKCEESETTNCAPTLLFYITKTY